MAAISLRNIEKAFGPTKVLGDVGLNVADGEFVSLVGPSGCGKSTLLRIIAGLEDPCSGDVLIDGRNVAGIRPSARDLAMVFQSYALYPHLSAERNALPLSTGELPRFPLQQLLDLQGARRLFDGCLDRPELPSARGRQTSQQGQPLEQRKIAQQQRQRVALGRAMVRKPVAFLMDEPLSNLDAALRVHMRAELAELHRALGATFIYVTHDQAEALTMSNRIAVMMGGNILQVATPEDIYDEPCDLRVAEFIGSPKINTLPATADADGHIAVFGRILPQRLVGTPGAVTVAVRPEHLRIGAGDCDQGLDARIIYKENLGADVFVHAALGGGITDVEHRVIVRSSPETARSLAVGTAVQLHLDPARILVFGADKGRLPLRETAAVRDRSPVMAGA